MKYYKIGKFKVKVEDSNRKNKQLKATFKDGTEIHFGDPTMQEYPNTKRGDNYCSRSLGIKSKNKSANKLSRKILWKCKGKKSMSTFKEAGVGIISMEDFE
ncbi:MAG: hypothetical protein ACLFPS_05840 [Clostridia bacterium]